MNYIFYFLIVFSLIFSIFTGKIQDVTNAVISGTELAVKVAFSLIGIMSFWLGIMRIVEKSGLLKIITKLIMPITRWLFNDVPKDNKAIGDITMSISANAIGLTNAATPIGLKAMKELQEINKDKNSASDSMCMFLAMNTAGFQIIPVTVIAVLAGIGYKNPTDIIIPTLIVTSISLLSAIFAAKILQKYWRNQL